jgi:heme/copper-type cytochrome/quinol oxidase subunit 2
MGEITQEDAAALIDARLQQGEHYFTLPEAAAMTGLSIDETRDAMEALLNKYVCRLQVSENGDLIYHFGDTLQRRGEKTATERCREVLAWLWRIFTVIYKAWIAVTLVVYFIVFLVVVVAALVAASSRQSSGDRRRQGGEMPIHMGSIVNLFLSIFHWRTVTGTIDYQRDAQGYRYRHYEPRRAVINGDKKNFMSAVYDFVFGPPRVELDPLSNEKEVASYLRQHNGIVVPAELSALAGWNLPQAETFLTDCILRYRGESKISDDPVLYGQFDELMRGVGEVETGQVTYYWDEYEPEYELNGNSATQNMIICVMNGFNLLVSLFIATSDLTALAAHGAPPDILAWLAVNSVWIQVVLGWIPLVFSVLFFVIPLVRWFQIRTLQRRRHEQNVRKRLFKAIFEPRGRPQTVKDVTAAVNRDSGEEALASPEIEAALKQLALDMPGDMNVSETAEIQFAFPRLTTELAAVDRLRQNRRDDDALGTIIMESDNR